MTIFDQFYNRIAGVYDLVYGVALRPGMKMSVDMMQLGKGMKLLEVGIGTGLSLDYYPRDIEVVGIDVSEPMLEQCRKKIAEGGFDNIEVANMSALDLNYDDDSFDRVFAPSVLSVIPRPERVVAEMLRVCKPDGLICVVSHFASEDLPGKLLDGLFDPVTQKIGGFRMDTPARVVESAPSGLVLRKRAVLKPLNFSTVYIMRKTSSAKSPENGSTKQKTRPKK